MSTIVIMPGGFHPFHAGHYSLYQSALKAFPGAEVYVAATNDQSERPFPFALKEKLAKLAGVAPGHFVQVKSPFQAKEITQNYNPEEDVLIFVRSEKDKNESPKPGGTKKDGSPSYFQPWTGKDVQPFAKHAYFAYLPTVEFGPGITSATQIRKAWPTLNDKRKLALVMSLYPAAQKNSKLAQNVVGMFDQVMGGQEGVAEGSDKTKVGRRNETKDWAWYYLGKDGKWKWGGIAKSKAEAQSKARDYESKQGVAEGWKDVVAGGAMALGALGAGAQTMPDINTKQVELANKYYNVLVQRAKEDGIKLDTRTLNAIKAKATDAAAQKFQQNTPQQNTFPSKGSERKVSKDIGQFESQDVAEGEQPGKSVVDAIRRVMPVTQEIWFHGSRATGKHRRNSDTDILVVVPDNLVGEKYLGAVKILQKLNSHFDNYDIQPTKTGTNIHRIAQEEGRLLWSKQGVAEGMVIGCCPNEDINEGKIKDIEDLLARHAQYYLDKEQNEGPLSGQDIHSRETIRKQLLAKKKRLQAEKDRTNEDERTEIHPDSELNRLYQFAQQHYPNMRNKQDAFVKYVTHALKHSEEDDARQDNQIDILDKEVDQIQKKLNVTENTDYLEEK